MGKSQDWLMAELSNKKLQVKQVFYAEWSEQYGFYLKTYDNLVLFSSPHQPFFFGKGAVEKLIALSGAET
ncbi:hypothetical protein CVD28_12440 [Bacillus sp. M6-12]|nr:hypothetical protein [Bacillus sp. M6-12]PLS17368.1 hypothetical protein CVD28_12440 [Bacillus sp. M6-12]